MTKESLVSDIKKYLAEGTPAEQEARRKEEEKRIFVSAVRDFVQTPEIMGLLKRVDGSLSLLEIYDYIYRGPNKDDIPFKAYEIFVQQGSLYVLRNDNRHHCFMLPATLEQWMALLPYGGHFAHHDEPWKPSTEQYLGELERKIQGIMKTVWR